MKNKQTHLFELDGLIHSTCIRLTNCASVTPISALPETFAPCSSGRMSHTSLSAKIFLLNTLLVILCLTQITAMHTTWNIQDVYFINTNYSFFKDSYFVAETNRFLYKKCLSLREIRESISKFVLNMCRVNTRLLTPQTNVTVNPNKTADTFSPPLFYSDNVNA